ncbi:MAG: YeeE/YedE family protein [Anaerolineae bacterium]|nr:YeeE/YedE family protein [Anaerolineae bacterium]
MQPLDVSLWAGREIALALLLGFWFGFALDKGGMTRYHKIVNVFRYTDLAVLKFMMSAMVTGLLGTYALYWAGEIELAAITATLPARQLIGGALFGVGMALAGMCPGTVVAGAGRGQLDYLIPGVAGFLSGALLFGMLTPRLDRFFADLANTSLGTHYGTVKLWELWGLNSALLVLVVAQAILLLLYVLGRLNPARRGGLRLAPRPIELAQPGAAGD